MNDESRNEYPPYDFISLVQISHASRKHIPRDPLLLGYTRAWNLDLRRRIFKPRFLEDGKKEVSLRCTFLSLDELDMQR